MLYFCTSADHGPGLAKFNAKLTQRGQQQAKLVAQVLDQHQVVNLFAARNRPAMFTAQAYTMARRSAHAYLRATFTHDLNARVQTGDQVPPRYAVREADAERFGVSLHAFEGMPVQEQESMLDYERRVVDWYTNHFQPLFEDSPVPTAVVADGLTLSIVARFMLRRSPDVTEDVLRSLFEDLAQPGCVYAFTSDGLYMLPDKRLV